MAALFVAVLLDGSTDASHGVSVPGTVDIVAIDAETPTPGPGGSDWNACAVTSPVGAGPNVASDIT